MSIQNNNPIIDLTKKDTIITTEITTIKNPETQKELIITPKEPDVKETYRQKNLAKARCKRQKQVMEKNLKEKEQYEKQIEEDKKLAEDGLKKISKPIRKRNVTPSSNGESEDEEYKPKYKKNVEISEIKEMVNAMNNRLNKMYGMQKTKQQLKQKQPIINIPPPQIIQEKPPKSETFKKRLMDLAN